jgi:peptide/nickel transport system ATP-binding protein
MALLRAAPGAERQGERLMPIPGTPPVLRGPAPGCAFAPRCPRADALCHAERPPLRRAAGREVLCHHAAPA